MTKTLRKITGLCGAALLVAPLAGGLQQVKPTNASARRRTHRSYHRTYHAPARHRSYHAPAAHRSYRASRGTKRAGVLAGRIRSSVKKGHRAKKSNQSKATGVLARRIKANLRQSRKRGKRTFKRAKRSYRKAHKNKLGYTRDTASHGRLTDYNDRIYGAMKKAQQMNGTSKKKSRRALKRAKAVHRANKKSRRGRKGKRAMRLSAMQSKRHGRKSRKRGKSSDIDPLTHVKYIYGKKGTTTRWAKTEAFYTSGHNTETLEFQMGNHKDAVNYAKKIRKEKADPWVFSGKLLHVHVQGRNLYEVYPYHPAPKATILSGYIDNATYNSVMAESGVSNIVKAQQLSLEQNPPVNAPQGQNGSVSGYTSFGSFYNSVSASAANATSGSSLDQLCAAGNFNPVGKSANHSDNLTSDNTNDDNSDQPTTQAPDQFGDDDQDVDANKPADNATAAVQKNADQDTGEFDNIVNASPISSKDKQTDEDEFNTDPVDAAQKFANEVDNVSPDVLAGDSSFRQAIGDGQAANTDVPSVAYSDNPTKATQQLNKNNKSTSTSTVATKNPTDAAESNLLQEDRDAFAGMKQSMPFNANSDQNTNKANGQVQKANPSLEQVPQTLTGSADLQSAPTGGHTVKTMSQLLNNGSNPDFDNTFMIYQQQKLNDGTLMDHVVSYNGKTDGWVPDSAVKAAKKTNNVTVPSGKFYFKNPSKDQTYELPVGSTLSDPYILKPTSTVGADSLKVTAARTTDNNGKKTTSYYVEDADHPFVNGWVNAENLSQSKAKGASSKKADTPKSTGTGYTKFSINVEGDLSDAPVTVNSSKAGNDDLRLPASFSNAQVKALHGKKSADIDWSSLNGNFFNSNKNMNNFEGTATYFEENGHPVFIPKEDIAAIEATGKKVFHYEYKVDKTATKNANKGAKNGDVVNVYYTRVKVNGAAGDTKAKGQNNKAVTSQTNQKTSNKANQSISVPNK